MDDLMQYRPCAYCGLDFVPTYPGQRCCSLSHQVALENERYYKANKERIINRVLEVRKNNKERK